MFESQMQLQLSRLFRVFEEKISWCPLPYEFIHYPDVLLRFTTRGIVYIFLFGILGEAREGVVRNKW